MGSPFSTNPFLSKGFEPIRIECDSAYLALEGEVPPDLEGTFHRIGPNPQFAPRGAYNPLSGDGMVHMFRLSKGRVSYRNRWVRTQQWKLEHAAGRALFGTSGNPADSDSRVAAMRTDGVANTNLVWHGKRLLALEEGHAPIEIDPDSLATIGRWSFVDRLPHNMTAHPKIDPESGEMLFFANFPSGRFTGDVEVYIAARCGELVRAEMIHGPFAALIHDFAISRDFVIMPMCPVTVSIKRAMAGGPPIAWEPDKGTQIAIMPRGGGVEDTRWFSGPPCMTWHLVNAFDDGGSVIVDVCQQEAAVFPHADGSPTDPKLGSQYLTRWTFDWANPGSFAVKRLSEVCCEYPRIDERRIGLNYRYSYVACQGGPGSGDIFHRGIGVFDHADGKIRVYSAGARFAVAEPVFVPRDATAAEGEGYLLTNIYDEDRNASHLAIFDARDVEHGPIARAHLDHRVPVCFHAIWKPA